MHSGPKSKVTQRLQRTKSKQCISLASIGYTPEGSFTILKGKKAFYLSWFPREVDRQGSSSSIRIRKLESAEWEYTGRWTLSRTACIFWILGMASMRCFLPSTYLKMPFVTVFSIFLAVKQTGVQKQGIDFSVRKPLILLESFKIYRWGWQRRMWRWRRRFSYRKFCSRKTLFCYVAEESPRTMFDAESPRRRAYQWWRAALLRRARSREIDDESSMMMFWSQKFLTWMQMHFFCNVCNFHH